MAVVTTVVVAVTVWVSISVTVTVWVGTGVPEPPATWLSSMAGVPDEHPPSTAAPESNTAAATLARCTADSDARRDGGSIVIAACPGRKGMRESSLRG
ncbi:hypothetical protein GCM10009858_07270 [Terrabacter carboxydivorans]|uniref:Secreted protein n=1 Tax=Terrabacter carboxydivorans TaxID=619730 RepID=A0ABN3KXZ5_9MICO